jgi:hypothetical protein
MLCDTSSGYATTMLSAGIGHNSQKLQTIIAATKILYPTKHVCIANGSITT